MRNRLLVTLVLGLSAALLAGPLAPVAVAAPAAPTGLSPDGSSVSSNPVLSWTAVPKATSYRVELSRSGTFDTIDYSVSTVNRQATPTIALPSGELFWRVRSADATGAVSSWTTASFTLSTKAPPTQLTPTDGEVLSQPQEPPQLTWAPVNGATSYELAYGTDPNLSTSSAATTKTTSYAFTKPQAQATYFWKVRAVLGSGQATDWSEISSYDVEPLAQPALVGPANSPDTVVTDVVLEWTRVPGASKYEVRVSTDQNFTTLVAQATSVATRWSPAVTLDNDQYWWQVRAYDSENQARNWVDISQTWQFERRWQFGPTATVNPDRPALVHPANGVSPVSQDPFYYQWEPVRLASEYKLQVGTDANFSAGTFKECSTKQTTFTPQTGEMTSGSLGCRPSSGGTHYWRVQAVDQTKGVLTPWSDIRSFTYRPGSVAFRAPADGATVEVPTMKWDLTPGAERYKLTYSYTGSSGRAITTTVTTYSTSHSPNWTVGQPAIPVGKTVTWFVQAIYANNDETALPLTGARTFIVGPAPTTAPTPDALAADTTGDRFPSLSWMPVAGAAYYKLYVGTAGTDIFQTVPEEFAHPAGTDLNKIHLDAKDYEWFVQAYTSTGSLLTTGSEGSFTITDIAPVTGQTVAHIGTEVDAAARCTLSHSNSVPNVCPVRQTPVLDWNPVVGASSYQVYVARDKSLTNRIYNGVVTHSTRWTPTEQLPDSQAGQAYYWAIRPCKAATVCGPDPTEATNAFDKTSYRVKTTAPSNGATVADAVTFSWDAYLATNTAPAVTAARSRVEAKQYKVEVSTSETFSPPILDTATVDQTTYTAATKIYPEGPLYWRVSALDGTANTVGTSDVQTATKQSTPVMLQSPNGTVSPGTPALRWVPRAFAASYDVEVYKDNDTNFSSANRVFSGSTELSAFSLASPLPASALPYVWRVRSKDVSGNAGPWSVARTFTVRGDAPAQVAPAADVRVSATSGLFTWGAVAGTSSYRFERRKSGSATATETVNTVGLAWAPTSKLSDGTWEWRVSTVDAAGKVVATSAWRAFRVDGTAPTVVATTPSSSARPRTNVTATFSEPVRGATTGTMKLFQQGRQHPVSATVSLSATKLKATLNPATNLLVGRTYRAVLTSGITDTARNPLAKREWTFTVYAA